MSNEKYQQEVRDEMDFMNVHLRVGVACLVVEWKGDLKDERWEKVKRKLTIRSAMVSQEISTHITGGIPPPRTAELDQENPKEFVAGCGTAETMGLLRALCEDTSNKDAIAAAAQLTKVICRVMDAALCKELSKYMPMDNLLTWRVIEPDLTPEGWLKKDDDTRVQAAEDIAGADDVQKLTSAAEALRDRANTGLNNLINANMLDWLPSTPSVGAVNQLN
eukprot:TRINITY_DN113211_c0_g1_i1.p1 TRINITY_DN113211_c0_g1~~TRINITY_DN113211_c0_g1_i1.p1  ORF type:complete len:243 (+),score=38.17 TRINITY_DN113211_c0_g1_i1:71-730(+)